MQPLIKKTRIKKKLKQLAKEIKKDYHEEVFCIVVLTGAIVFFNDLMKELKKLDMTIYFEPIKLSSYQGKNSTGKVNIKLDIEKHRIKDRSLLIIEDIVDTGITSNFLKDHLLGKGAKEVRLASLLDKPKRRIKDIKIDYLGFEIPDQFVVGYGLDYDEKYRDLDAIYSPSNSTSENTL